MKQTLTLFAFLACVAIHAQTFTTYTTADGLPTNNLRDISIAPNGDIWLASQAGVARFDGSTFEVHNTVSHPGLVTDNIEAIAAMANGDVWVGTDLGASVYNGSTYTTYTTVDGLGENQINNIKQAPNGDIWLGTINGATRYSNGTFTAFGSPNIPFGGVEHIAFAANGDVWLGGGLGGVIRYDGTTFSTLTTAQGLISNKIRSVAFTTDQKKWVATARGISTFDAADQHLGDHTRPFILPAPDTLNPVTDIAIDSRGYVWAAVYVDYLVTEGGVCVFDGTSWHQFETADGLAGPNVRRIAIDADDAVWVTTSTGLTRIGELSIGLEEVAGNIGFGLYPNPASDLINIELEQAVSVSSRIELFDAQLRLVRSHRVTTDRTRIDVQDLDPGMYFCRIGNGLRKFVVER